MKLGGERNWGAARAPPVVWMLREVFVEVSSLPAQTNTLTSTFAAGHPEWRGTDRYEVRRRLGHGGMGVVYEAFDKERGQCVALKTVIHTSPSALYLFKQEFRTLADVQHPNLVKLYELVATETEDVFFTMELVQGTDFISYVHKPGAKRAGVRSPTAEANSRERPTERPKARLAPASPIPARPRSSSPADFDKLRLVLRQLAEGVQALHAAGKLHRDIKPSNVLVSQEGRVVLLDFGVATELQRVADENFAEEQQIVGTGSYMAPEQGAGEPATSACDWYSVGVMLYEALVGAPPFVGALMDVIMMKNTVDPRPPSDVVGDVPRDLDALCLDLLQCAAEDRPAGPEILTRLGVDLAAADGPSRSSRLPVAAAVTRTTLVGRDSHLETLRGAFDATLTGRAVTIRVSGRSGMGKSSLVDHFLDGLAERGEAVILRGRAYERESVPFKAVDSVIDALSRYLMHLTERAEGLTLPTSVGALARVFPVLRRVPSVDEAPDQGSKNPQRVRVRAFAALGELLNSLARRQPLVVYVDDAQWGDTDSAALLLDLMHPSNAPPLLLVMAHREEEAKTSPFLLETQARWPERAEVRDLVVGPLDPEDAQRLALTMLGPDSESTRETAAAVARESRGSPFLIEELVRGATDKLNVTLEEIVGDRIARLPDFARRFLEVVAVAGKPLSVSIARDASSVDESPDEVVTLLRSRRFVRAGLRDGHEVVETSHDRIRETIVSMLPSLSVRTHHLRLAEALEANPGVEAEAVALHLFGAGEGERAAQYAERAAENAIAKLAFDQAARLLKPTLATMPAGSADAQRVRKRLAAALKWAGRSSEAGTAYLEAAECADLSDRATLEREAAEQLLSSGRLEEGSEVLRRVLAAAGVKAPRSPISALFWLLVYRMWLTVIGTRFRERAPEDIPSEEHLRLQAMFAAAQGLSLGNVILGACMEARYLILALRAGHRMHVLRAVAYEVSHLASLGGPPRAREQKLLQLAEHLSENLDNIEVGMALEGTRVIALFLRGHWKRAREVYDVEYAKYRTARAGGHSVPTLFSLYSLVFLGEIRELGRRRTQTLIQAEQRGDLYVTVNLRSSCAFYVWLAADDAATARRQVREAMAQWPKEQYLTQNWQALVCEVETDLFVGDGASAYDRVVREHRLVKRSLLLNVQFIRACHHNLRGRAAVASIAACPELRSRRLSEARAMVKLLEGERMPWTDTLAAALSAAVAHADGDRAATLAALRRAIDLAQATDMGNWSHVARYRLGSLLGAEEGLPHLERAREALLADDIKAPSRWADLFIPGRWPE